MKIYKQLIIKCNSNPDFSGNFHAEDVIDEMESVGISPIIGNDWIEYVVGHFEFSPEIDDAIVNDNVIAITFKQDGHLVEVIKK